MADASRLLIIEHLVSAPNQPGFGKVSDIQMMVRTGGRNRTLEELRDLLTAGGFQLRRVIDTAGGPDVVEVTAVSGDRQTAARPAVG